jgi:hypothetical protein
MQGDVIFMEMYYAVGRIDRSYSREKTLMVHNTRYY